MRGQCSSQLLEAGSSAGPAVTHCQVRALTWDSTALSTALLSCQHCINNLSNTGVFWPQPSKDGCCHMPVQGALVVDILISENSTQEAQFKCMIYLSRYFSIFSATAGAVSFLNTKILQWSEAAHTRTHFQSGFQFTELQFTLAYKGPIFPDFHMHGGFACLQESQTFWS